MRWLLEMFAQGKNCSVRPQLWGDTYENILLRPSDDIDREAGTFSYADDLYAQSWTLTGYSDALWRILLPGSERHKAEDDS